MNPNAISILENNQDKVDWNQLSQNPNAIDLLDKNQDKISWYYLSKNPNAIGDIIHAKAKSTIKDPILGQLGV